MRIEKSTLDAIWPLRAEVLRDGQPPESARFYGDHDPRTLHLAALGDGGRVIGCLSLMVRPMPGAPAWTHQLRGMAVHPEHRGRGVGGRLLEQLQRLAGEAAVWCNAREAAVGFYQRHGWVAVSEPFDIPHHGPHRRMVRPLRVES